MTTVQLKTFGSELRTRESARAIRLRLDLSDKVSFDLEDVSLMTPSFCDELFGLLFVSLQEKGFREKVTIKNVADDLKPIIRFALQSRKESLKTAS